MVRWLRVVLCSVALAGCGGGDDSGDDDGDSPDAGDTTDIDGGIGGEPDAMVPSAECNPVSQTGCMAGEKCSSIRDMPTSCQAAGTVTGGGACTVPEGGGPDDCEAGFICINDLCLEICSESPADTCGMGSCATFDNYFGDLEAIGACLPNCMPLLQDCPGEGEGCYLTRNGSVCVRVFGDGIPDGGACEFINECNPGSGCFGPAGESVCRTYCDFSMHPNEADPDHCKPAEVCGGVEGEDVIGICVEEGA